MDAGIHNPVRREIDSPDPLSAREFDRRQFITVCTIIIGLCLLLKLPTLYFERAEGDELIYWGLTENWLEHGRYSLQGTEILKTIPAEMYDKPLFHHPPMISILLAPFVYFHSHTFSILVSWLGHVLAVVGVAIWVWTMRKPEWRPTDIFMWLPVLAMAMDPVYTFAARKLWPDPILGGFVAMALGLAVSAVRRQSLGTAFGAGLCLAAASLTKLPALLIAPALVVLVAKAPQRNRLLAVLLIPSALLAGIWLIDFRITCGAFLPMWSRPSAALIASSKHIANSMNRPWHYYISQLALVTPATVAIAVGAAMAWRRISLDVRQTCAVWLIATIGGLTLLSFQGHAMHLRFMSVVMPGAYALFASTLSQIEPRRSLFPLVTLLLVIYGVIGMGFYIVYGPEFDEIVSIPELMWRMLTGSRH